MGVKFDIEDPIPVDKNTSLRRYTRILGQVAHSKVMNMSILIAVGFVLLIGPLSLWLFPQSTDFALGVVYQLILIVFLAETVMSSIAKPSDIGQIYFWLDCISILSIIPDILLYLCNINHGFPLPIVHFTKIACLGRASKILIARATKEDSGSLGPVLLELTTRKIIVGVILVLLLLPYLYWSRTGDIPISNKGLLPLSHVPKNETSVLMALTKQFEITYPNVIGLYHDGNWLLKHSNFGRPWEILWISSTGSKGYGWSIPTGTSVIFINIHAYVSARAGFNLLLVVIVLLLLGVMSFSLKRDQKRLILIPMARMGAVMSHVQGNIDMLKRKEDQRIDEFESMLSNVSTLMQTTVSITTEFDEDKQAEVAVDEILSALNGNRGYLFWFESSEMVPICRRRRVKPNDEPLDPEELEEDEIDIQFVPDYVQEVVNFVIRNHRAILINSPKDLAKAETDVLSNTINHVGNCRDPMQRSNSVSWFRRNPDGAEVSRPAASSMDPRVFQRIRKHTIACIPIKGGGEYVLGVLYVEKRRGLHKDVSALFGGDPILRKSSSGEESRSKIGGFVRRMATRAPLKPATTPVSDFKDSDLDLLQVLGNQVGGILHLTRTVRSEVEDRLNQTQGKLTQIREDSVFIRQGTQQATENLMHGDMGTARRVAQVVRLRLEERTQQTDGIRRTTQSLGEF